MSTPPDNFRDLDEFLAQLSVGTHVSSGSFSLSPEKMLEKLGQAVTDPSLWTLKLAQAAVAAEASFLVVKVGKRELKAQVIAKSHLELGEAESFLAATERTRPHHHLLLGFLWLTRMSNIETASLRWSTADSVEQVDFENSGFTCSSFPVAGQYPYRFLELRANARPLSLVQRMFGRAFFVREIQHLESRTYLAPLTILVDGRSLHQSSFHPRAIERGLYEKPGSSGLRRFVYPRRLLPVLEAGARERHRIMGAMDGARPEVTAYLEVVAEAGKSCVRWVVDGVTIQEQPAAFSHVDPGFSLQLYLSANGLKTDLSTLSLAENPEVESHLHDQVLWDWCLGLG